MPETVEIPTAIAINLGLLLFLNGWAWRGAIDGIRARKNGRSTPPEGLNAIGHDGQHDDCWACGGGRSAD